MPTWFEEYVIDPLNGSLARTPVGAQVTDEGLLRSLAIGIDGLFRTEVAQYPGWPPESTTDGSEISLCIRSGEDSIDAIGMTFIDFGSEKFPCRVEMTAANDSASIVAYIGQVDAGTGAPPRLPTGSLIAPARDRSEGGPIAELIVGRRQFPILWTKVFEVPQR